ncbi:MAG TPA: hypothetical protein VHC96_17880 [Puia sp.]|jgi:hypothetical protein|nr:hypothetical protein [Puia sp.]
MFASPWLPIKINDLLHPWIEILHQRMEHYMKLFLQRIKNTILTKEATVTPSWKPYSQDSAWEVMKPISSTWTTMGWWELMPAMTKGLIGKVIFPGVAYDYDNSGR